MILIVMGVSGVGKTEVGIALAAELGLPFYDADAFHPAENIAKMTRGLPLTAVDREPWLEALHHLLIGIDRSSGGAVLACSALTASFRDRLVEGIAQFRFIDLEAPEAVIAARLTHRKGHFFKAPMLATQLALLERPQNAITVDATVSVEQVVAEVRCRLAVAG